jgi:hypothetical protein
MGLTLIYDLQDKRVFGLCMSSSIPKEHSILETVAIFR